MEIVDNWLHSNHLLTGDFLGLVHLGFLPNVYFIMDLLPSGLDTYNCPIRLFPKILMVVDK